MTKNADDTKAIVENLTDSAGMRDWAGVDANVKELRSALGIEDPKPQREWDDNDVKADLAQKAKEGEAAAKEAEAEQAEVEKAEAAEAKEAERQTKLAASKS